MSPASTVSRIRKGYTSANMLYGLTRREAFRIADGPSRAPLRYEVASSQGIPRNTLFAPTASRRTGSLANVATCANRGDDAPSSGSVTHPRPDQSGGRALNAIEMSTPGRRRWNERATKYHTALPTKTKIIVT